MVVQLSENWGDTLCVSVCVNSSPTTVRTTRRKMPKVSYIYFLETECYLKFYSKQIFLDKII